VAELVRPCGLGVLSGDWAWLEGLRGVLHLLVDWGWETWLDAPVFGGVSLRLWGRGLEATGGGGV